METCSHCSAVVQDVTLIESGSSIVPHKLCEPCKNEYKKGNIMLAYCSECSVEFSSKMSVGPFLCPKCKAEKKFLTDLAKSNVQIKLFDGHPVDQQSTDETIHWDYPIPVSKAIRAIADHLDAKYRFIIDGEVRLDKVGRRIVAVSMYRRINDIPETEPVLNRIRTDIEAQQSGFEQYLDMLYRMGLVQSAIDEVVRSSREQGYNTYKARSLDKSRGCSVFLSGVKDQYADKLFIHDADDLPPWDTVTE